MMLLLIVTLTSMLLAAIMSGIAWRIAGDERRRSEARVAALSADIHAAAPVPVPILARAGASRRGDVSYLADGPRPGPAWDRDLEIRPRVARVHGDSARGDLFMQQQARSGWRTFAVLAGGAVVFAAAVAMAILVPGRFGGGSRVAHPAAAAAPAALPLELMALGDERDGDHLTVRGIVRNPPAGAGMDRLTAVVVLLTLDGEFVESGRAAVETPALQPGGESTFAVTVPHAGDVGRYRVSFRTDDRVVSHVDRRHEQS